MRFISYVAVTSNVCASLKLYNSVVLIVFHRRRWVQPTSRRIAEAAIGAALDWRLLIDASVLLILEISWFRSLIQISL